ncbi:glycosyltransferase [Paraburkholderia aromaticivorans]|uniref:glycosyltransferase n=1 Tax=Paraburkholderia aromaticivorans TaxID=2026199 RepID=UPI001455E999|nr:glycosyltransferase family 2 protein [Paraburkholderia aromaticivorans]
MLAVVIPAHNEAELIGPCVRSIIHASRHSDLDDEEVRIFVVMDSCTDATGLIAASLGAQLLSVEMRNVGVARATGAQTALAQGARWLAFSDADTTVAEDWLAQQIKCRTDAVCGVISIENWAGHNAAVRQDFTTTYVDRDGHRHIHGANLGVSAAAYVAVGGFRPFASNEDVALVEALIAANASVAWSAATRVVTSARLDSRAPQGFGATLRAVSLRLGRPDEPANDALSQSCERDPEVQGR